MSLVGRQKHDSARMRYVYIALFLAASVSGYALYVQISQFWLLERLSGRLNAECRIITDDEQWRPNLSEIATVKTALLRYAQERLEVVESNSISAREMKYVEARHGFYKYQMRGETRNGKRVLFIKAYDIQGGEGWKHSHFWLVCDGGAGVLTIVFDLETKSILYLSGNGYA